MYTLTTSHTLSMYHLSLFIVPVYIFVYFLGEKVTGGKRPANISINIYCNPFSAF